MTFALRSSFLHEVGARTKAPGTLPGTRHPVLYQLRGTSTWYQVRLWYHGPGTWCQALPNEYLKQEPGTWYQVPANRCLVPGSRCLVTGTWYRDLCTRHLAPGI